MKKKIKIVAIILIIIILLILRAVISYYFEYNRETLEPDEEKRTCNISVKSFKDRKVFYVEPKHQKTDLNILYFHGGSYMAEATKDHWEFIQKLAMDLNATVIMPDYPLAPKSNYREVYDMAEPLYKELSLNIEKEKLIVMGDSAGGGLALGLMEKISSEDIKIPNKIILISPWLDVRLQNSEIDEIQKKDKQLNKDALILAGLAYSDGDDNYLINPIDGNLSKLKDITVLIGTDDILNPDVHLLQEKAKESEINVEIKEYENAGHIWFIENNAQKEIIDRGYQDLLDIINK